MKKILMMIALVAACIQVNAAELSNELVSTITATQVGPNVCAEYDGIKDFASTHCVLTLEDNGTIQLQIADGTGRTVLREGTYTCTGKGAYHVKYSLNRVQKKNGEWVESLLNGSFSISINKAAKKATITPRTGNQLGIGIGRTRTVDCK